MKLIINQAHFVLHLLLTSLIQSDQVSHNVNLSEEKQASGNPRAMRRCHARAKMYMCVCECVTKKKRKKHGFIGKGRERPKGGAMEPNGWELKHSKGCSIAANTNVFRRVQSSRKPGSRKTLLFFWSLTDKEHQSLYRWGRAASCWTNS